MKAQIIPVFLGIRAKERHRRLCYSNGKETANGGHSRLFLGGRPQPDSADQVGKNKTLG